MTLTRHNRRASKTRAGFTLLELMVALVAGLIAITSIYFVSAASTRHFHEQQRIAQTQMSLRMAMEQMRRDVQRAGYFGTPNSDGEAYRRCSLLKPTEPLQAVDFQDGADTDALPNAAQNGATADRLVLTGNFETGGGYLAREAPGTAVRLQTQWQSFRRDFGAMDLSSGPYAYDENAEAKFRDVFRPGRRLFFQKQNGVRFPAEITGVDEAEAKIHLGSAIPQQCTEGHGGGMKVAPLSTVEYVVTDLTTGVGDKLAPLGGTVDSATDYRGRSPTHLVRRELDADGDVIPNSQRIILEYVASVDYEFVIDTQATPGNPPQLQRMRGSTAETAIDLNPERVRSVIVTLAARTAEQDPRFPWVASAAGDPATGRPPSRYKVHTSSDFPGAARVRTQSIEIPLPNVANRMMRP